MARSSHDSLMRKGDPSLKYFLREVLGEGSYGTVYRGVSISSKEEFAIKILPFDVDGESLITVAKEIGILKNLRSPYVVSFHDSYIFNNEMWIIMECCHGGSLIDLMEITSFQEEEIRAVMAYCCLGLSYLHSKKCIHRDIKSGNILLTLGGKAKIADFGVSAQLSTSMMRRKTIIGSPFWMAPEMIGESSYDGKADIWSLGITLYELCTGSPPHFTVSPLRAIFLISAKPAPKLPSRKNSVEGCVGNSQDCDWSDELKSFIGLCLRKDSNNRSSAKDLLDHPFISAYVSLITENEEMYNDSYDTDSSTESMEAVGLTVLMDLVEDNLPALKERQNGKQKKKGEENELEKKLSQKKISASSTLRVNSQEQINGLTRNSTPQMSKERKSSTDWGVTERPSKPPSSVGPSPDGNQRIEQKIINDEEWMYGLEDDYSQAICLDGTFVRKVDPHGSDESVWPSDRSTGLSPRLSFIVTPQTASTEASSLKGRGNNIQTALRYLKESEDAKTGRKSVGALPPLPTLSQERPPSAVPSAVPYDRTLMSPIRTGSSGDHQSDSASESCFTSPYDNSPKRTRQSQGQIQIQGQAQGVGQTQTQAVLVPPEPREPRPFFLTALDTIPRSTHLSDLLKATPSQETPGVKDIPAVGADILLRTKTSRRVSIETGENRTGGAKTVQSIHDLLNELEIEHKTTIFELEAAYEAKRRALLRKLRTIEHAV